MISDKRVGETLFLQQTFLAPHVDRLRRHVRWFPGLDDLDNRLGYPCSWFLNPSLGVYDQNWL